MVEVNENRPVAIQVSGVKKMYRLGQIGGGTLQADLQSWWARIRGKEDPNSKVGQKQRLVGKRFPVYIHGCHDSGSERIAFCQGQVQVICHKTSCDRQENTDDE